MNKYNPIIRKVKILEQTIIPNTELRFTNSAGTPIVHAMVNWDLESGDWEVAFLIEEEVELLYILNMFSRIDLIRGADRRIL